jgi:ATP-dependent Lhr-like helicase
MDVEGSLRGGLLQAAVSSTSLELGIDIGSIDLVVQIGSPKSVAKGLQRIGRAGHQYGGTSKGRIVVFESDDLVECAVLCRAAHRKLIDRVTIPVNSLDVLAQCLVGLSIEKRWNADEAYELIRRSYCYKDLSKKDFESVMRYLGGKDEFEGIYSKLWYDEKERVFGKKRGSRMIYYLNQGTIPEEADYNVFSDRGSLIGSLSEKFVERLSQGDIFVLGGRSYEFIKSKGTKVFVKSASGRKPTVPSWTGEMLPRSFDLSVLIAQFRGEMEQRLQEMTDQGLSSWLMEEFDVDEGSATTIVNYFKEQDAVAKIPTDSRLLIEGYVDASGNKNAIFHYPFGRRVNDALSRAYASALSEKLRCNITVSVTDDSFMLTVPKNFALQDLSGLVSSESLERMLRSAIRDSELFNQRFRHTATRSFMILRNYKGKELSVARQQLRSSRLLDALREIKDFPVMVETYDEILTDVMDLEHAREILTSIESGKRTVEYLPFSGVPSPFAHNVILVGVSDIVLMEDRSMLLRELHRRVLARVLGDEAAVGYQFDVDKVEEYFSAKFPKITTKQDIVAVLRLVGPMNLFREKGESVFSHTKESFSKVRGWGAELLREGKVRSVWIGEDVYVASEDYPLYASLHARKVPHSRVEEKLLGVLVEGPKSVTELTGTLGLEKEDVREGIRRLESANEIFRADLKSEKFIYSKAEFEPLPRDECLREAVSRHVTYHAPITVEDLAYEVGVTEQEAESVARDLTLSESLVSGRFVVGEQQQYLSAMDFLKLKSAGQPVFDRETVRRFAERKQFEKLKGVRDYFERFGEAGMVYDLFQRIDKFSMEEFGELRKKGDILLGRFVREKIRYVLKEDAPYYLGAYRREPLDRFEAELVKVISKMESGTFLEIEAASKFPPDAMREHFDSLDRKGQLIREYDEAESWSSRNVYSLCDIEPADYQESLEHVLSKYVKGFGPVTVLQAASYLDIEPDDAKALLDRIGAKSVMVGLEQTQMFLFADEMPKLEQIAPSDDSMRVLSLYDSFLSDKWTEITARYGEGWIYPVVHRGVIVGMIEKWLLAGSVEVREILLDEPQLLGQLIDSFDHMMKFYGTLGVEILRVRSVLGTEVGQLDGATKSEFLRRGFAEANGMLVKGRLVTPCFELPELLSVVFSFQNLDESTRLPNMASAIEKYGGLRSSVEALLRVNRFESLHKTWLKGKEILRGHLIPDRVGYCTSEEASLFKAARNRQLSSDEKLVMRIVSDQQPVRRERLLELSPLGREDTLEALKSLYDLSRVYLDGVQSYVSIKRRKIARETAWTRVIARIFECYGIMTAESLGTLLSHEIPMREIRKTLRRLEDEGALVKGYMLRGSGILHWASVGAFEKLGRTEFTITTVLSPEDNLVLFLRAGYRALLPETGRYAIFKGPALIGSFEGRMKGGKLEVSDLKGSDECTDIVSSYARRLGLALSEREEGRMSEWEIMEFYQKTHPGMKDE